jgi:hypothetical protein
MTIRSTLVALAIATAIAATAHAEPEAKKPSWADYHSTVVNKPVSIDVDTRIKKTTKIDDSYNTDNSRTDSTNGSYNQDNSRKDWTSGSYNTDNSQKAVDSYNTDLRFKLDDQHVNNALKSDKYQNTLDTQSANNGASMTGPTQLGFQGGFEGGNITTGAPSTSIGSGYGSHVYMRQDRDLSQSNSAVVDGANYGAISNLNVAHQGDGDLTMGPKGSIVGSRLGNDQTFLTGDQTQVQGNDQKKESQTSSNASDTTTVSTSKR